MKWIILSTIMFSISFTDINLAKCSVCHGADFGKVALGKSKVVSSMTEEEIKNSLLGYKNGKYNGLAKVMQDQVIRYTDEELSVTASMIKKIKDKNVFIR